MFKDITGKQWTAIVPAEWGPGMAITLNLPHAPGAEPPVVVDQAAATADGGCDAEANLREKASNKEEASDNQEAQPNPPCIQLT